MKIRLYILFVLCATFLGCDDQVEHPTFPMMMAEEPVNDNGVLTLHGDVKLVGETNITEWGFLIAGWGTQYTVPMEGKMSIGKYSAICPPILHTGWSYYAYAYAKCEDGKIIHSSNSFFFLGP